MQMYFMYIFTYFYKCAQTQKPADPSFVVFDLVNEPEIWARARLVCKQAANLLNEPRQTSQAFVTRAKLLSVELGKRA